MQFNIQRPKIVMIGAGNVAYHYTIALSNAGYNIVQVYSHTVESAEKLAFRVNARAITSLDDIDLGSDLLIFAVSDSILPDLVNNVNYSGQLAVHTSGTLPIDIFNNKAEHFGVIYPLQTLSWFRNINFQEVPLLIEANSAKNLINIKSIARLMSLNVTLADSNQRRQVHLAAVFASNFTNHMYAIANDLLKKSGFSYSILKPIILETALKAVEAENPKKVQTGPAIRMDKNVISRHLDMLSENKEIQALYNLITEDIIKTEQSII